MRGLNIAIVGATSLLGQEVLKILQQRRFPLRGLLLLAANVKAGTTLSFAGHDIEVHELGTRPLKEIDLAFFLSGYEAARHFGAQAAQHGTVVIDNSPAFSLQDNIPLVIPEINAAELNERTMIISNPHSPTIPAALVLAALHEVIPLKRVVIDTYQAVSASGSEGMEELVAQTHAVLEGRTSVPHIYPHQIAFNVLPATDLFLDNGYSKEEWKTIQELHKILKAPDLPISVTCVWVPVFIGHALSIHVELTKNCSAETARQILSAKPGLRVLDDPEVGLYPQPWSVQGQDEVVVGRIREDISQPASLVLWVAVDNLRKGASLNMVQIAESMHSRGFLHHARPPHLSSTHTVGHNSAR